MLVFASQKCFQVSLLVLLMMESFWKIWVTVVPGLEFDIRKLNT